MSTVAELLASDRFTSVDSVTAGWSDDRKYRVTTPDGTRYLLRVSAPGRTDHRRQVFDVMSQVADQGVPICRPVEIDTCDDGLYMLLEWIDGEDLGPLLPRIPASQQYELGVTSGRRLRTIHTAPAPEVATSWTELFNTKIDTKLRTYMASDLRYDGDEHLIRYVAENRHLLDGRPQTFQHGDYHPGNMMLSDGELYIIDFDRADIGDPWEEFNRIVWSAQLSPAFASGQLHGYVGGDPPDTFFRLLALYIATNTLSALPWAARFGQPEIETMLAQGRDVLTWYDNMRDPVPGWYLPAP
ncbi:phosphotransferase family protein [Pseudactinotalea sp.]|uniref:phosphotransferase family protein n=1 Tax=Pseudactinotalea sp. TaxID=1926260 RepID=UPI003B3A255F